MIGPMEIRFRFWFVVGWFASLTVGIAMLAAYFLVSLPEKSLELRIGVFFFIWATLTVFLAKLWIERASFVFADSCLQIRDGWEGLNTESFLPIRAVDIAYEDIESIKAIAWGLFWSLKVRGHSLPLAIPSLKLAKDKAALIEFLEKRISDTRVKEMLRAIC